MFLESKHVASIPGADKTIRVNISYKNLQEKMHMALSEPYYSSLILFGSRKALSQ